MEAMQRGIPGHRKSPLTAKRVSAPSLGTPQEQQEVAATVLVRSFLLIPGRGVGGGPKREKQNHKTNKTRAAASRHRRNYEE